MHYFFNDVSVGFFMETLQNGMFWKYFKLVKSRADGHCLVSSVTTFLRRFHHELIYNEHILQLINTETNNYYEKYAQFILSTEPLSLREQLNNYVDYKIYQSTFGDTVPLVIANALMIDLVIIERQGDEWSPRIIFGGNNDVKRCVYVYKNGEHYNGLDFVESLTPGSILLFPVINLCNVWQSSPVRDRMIHRLPWRKRNKTRQVDLWSPEWNPLSITRSPQRLLTCNKTTLLKSASGIYGD